MSNRPFVNFNISVSYVGGWGLHLVYTSRSRRDLHFPVWSEVKTDVDLRIVEKLKILLDLMERFSPCPLTLKGFEGIFQYHFWIWWEILMGFLWKLLHFFNLNFRVFMGILTPEELMRAQRRNRQKILITSRPEISSFRPLEIFRVFSSILPPFSWSSMEKFFKSSSDFEFWRLSYLFHTRKILSASTEYF